VAEAGFVDFCTRCEECISACPEKILVRGAGGFPLVDFSRGACTFCHACADVCQPGVVYFRPDLPPWHINIEITRNCLALRGVVCASCRDQCEQEAIRLRHQVGTVAVPEIVAGACNGCGACYAGCPTRAIRISRDDSINSEPVAQEVRE
jgi:ferredoxin-type protein NapF